jgi:hypothetical protein
VVRKREASGRKKKKRLEGEEKHEGVGFKRATKIDLSKSNLVSVVAKKERRTNAIGEAVKVG